MTSKQKRWVIKPFSPKLEQSDLRSILSPTGQPKSPEDTWSSSRDSDSLSFRFDSISVTGMQPTVMVSSGSGESTPDVVVQARQVAVSEDGSENEDWRPSSPSNLSSPGTPSSTGSHVGFYSFVDDPTSPEAGMNEAYMVSPERLAKLNTLKEKNSFKLQTYAEETRPGRLFQEANGDAPYIVEDAFTVHKVEEENPDRMEIIRSQAPRKNPALKEQWSALENLDLSYTPQRLMDGFSLCYNPASSNAQQVSAEPGAIDNEQIDFKAARKQFLMMEQSKQNPFLQSPQPLPYSPKLRGRTLSPMASIFTPKQLSKEDSPRENQIPLRTQQEAEKPTVIMTEYPEDGVQSGAIDDADTGLGDRNGGYASDGSISNDPTISDMGSSLSVPNAGETPIEREIRIAQEREESLRRLRGILHKDHSEIVEIKTKPILSQSSPQLKPPKTKETNRVSFLIQRELDLEKRRQSQKVSSLHNQETQGEAQDKLITSESQPEVPITSLRTSPRESPTNDLQQRDVSVVDLWTAEKPVLIDEVDLPESEEVLSPCCPHRHPDESMFQRNYKESSTTENQDVKVHITANPDENIHSKVRVFKENVFETQNSYLRTNKVPSWIVQNGNSMSGKDRLSSPLEPKKTFYTPTWRSRLECTSWSPQMQNAPDSIRQEIEQDLRREQELQELRDSSSQSFSVPISAPMTPVLTSVKSRSLPPTSEETLSSTQTSQKYMMKVDSVLPEKKKTDYSYSCNLDTSTVSQISMADKSPPLFSSRLSSRLPSVSIMTPQPWGSSKPMPPTPSCVTPIKPLSPLAEVPSPLSQKGLTETLMKDFEDRRVKLKLEESAYAGIQPIDDINNEVVEATRVIRHKNQRALQWEAGMYTNQESK
ncbi:mitotic interactor and substrate of PLK1-like isoform X2 [Myxocyprinus asiaticus]|nr:mitotic interactor and substrate of PLK1-like isoform X2 [Myxocyprinus asiaticus]